MLTVSTLGRYAASAGRRPASGMARRKGSVRAPIRRKPRGAYHHGDLERALVDAAVRTIQEQGARALTLRGVGARVGVSRTALYRHFDDKTALLARVALEGFRLFEAALVAALAHAAERGREPLETMSSAYVEFALASPAHYETMFGAALDDWSRYPDLQRQAGATFELLVNTILGGQRSGLIAAGDPVHLAGVTWSLCHGIATLGIARRLGHTGLAAHDLAGLGYRVLRNGLASGPRTPGLETRDGIPAAASPIRPDTTSIPPASKRKRGRTRR
jgi:AcrR family transcriptional regulator